MVTIVTMVIIRCEPADLAIMVKLQDFNPYQKIDLGTIAILLTISIRGL